MNNTKLFVANWKMNGSMDKIEHDFKLYLNSSTTNQKSVVFALPFIYIAYANKILEKNDAKYVLASQDLSRHDGFGAYTGEVSGDMLNECRVRYAIIGHSERSLLNDTDEILVQKLNAAFNTRLIPIYCIGENLEIRNSANYLVSLEQQLSNLRNVRKIGDLVIAYEPIWAIGTGIVPTSEQIYEVVVFIKDYMLKNFPQLEVSILYGGSVNGSNTGDIVSIENVDGVLVGGASLKPDEFIKICSFSNSK